MKLTATKTTLHKLMPLGHRVLHESIIQAAERRTGTERPALGVFNVQFHTAVAAIIGVLDELNAIHALRSHDEAIGRFAPDCALLKETSAALHKLTAYCDNLKPILSRFFSANESREEKRAKAELDKAIKPFRDFSAVPINRVKHANCTLSPITYSENRIHLGWYVEGHNGTAICPDDDVHRDVRAFSYARTIRAWIVGLVATATKLGELLARKFDIDQSTLASLDAYDTNYISALQRCSRLPSVFFPGELMLPKPCISYQERGAHVALLIGMNETMGASYREVQAGAQVYQALRADGVTKSFIMASPVGPDLDK